MNCPHCGMENAKHFHIKNCPKKPAGVVPEELETKAPVAEIVTKKAEAAKPEPKSPTADPANTLMGLAMAKASVVGAQTTKPYFNPAKFGKCKGCGNVVPRVDNQLQCPKCNK